MWSVSGWPTRPRTSTLIGVAASVFISGVAFVVQFLIDADGRADTIEQSVAALEQRMTAYAEETNARITSGFENVSEATALYGAVGASRLNADAVTDLVRTTLGVVQSGDPLIAEFAQKELDRLSGYFKALGQRSERHLRGRGPGLAALPHPGGQPHHRCHQSDHSGR